MVRAVAPPWPGAFTDCPDGRLMIHLSRVHPWDGPAEAGRVRLDGGQSFVETADGLLELIEYQAPGGRALRPGEMLADRTDEAPEDEG